MGCRTSFCIGGGCVPTSTNVQAWMSAFGFQYNASDPLGANYKDLLAEAPAPFNEDAAWLALAEACMRSRSLLFCNSTPGDAGTTQTSQESSSLLGASISSGTGAEESEISAGVGAAESVASTLGASLPGLGSALDLVFQAFQHHAQAEQAQSNALSKLCPYFSECVRNADIAVATGQSSPEEAVAFLQSCASQFQASDASLTKQCNAFCWYNQIVGMIAEVSVYYYQILAPSHALSAGEPLDPTNVQEGLLSQRLPAATSSVVPSTVATEQPVNAYPATATPATVSSISSTELIIAALVVGGLAWFAAKGTRR